MAKARAVVQVGDKHFEVQQFDLPRLGPDEALLPGHEPVGLSAEIGAEADRRVIV